MGLSIAAIPTLTELRDRRAALLQIAENYGVTNVRIFGSVARNEAIPTSAVDFLVDLRAHFTLLKLSGLVREWRELIGWSVEVASAAHLREEVRDTILKEAQPL